MSSKIKVNKNFKPSVFSKAIIKKRQSDELSLNDTAILTGLSKLTILRAEQEKGVSIDTLVTLSNWLDVPVQTFFQ